MQNTGGVWISHLLGIGRRVLRLIRCGILQQVSRGTAIPKVSAIEISLSRVVVALVEGVSINATCRMTGVAKHTATGAYNRSALSRTVSDQLLGSLRQITPRCLIASIAKSPKNPDFTSAVSDTESALRGSVISPVRSLPGAFLRAAGERALEPSSVRSIPDNRMLNY